MSTMPELILQRGIINGFTAIRKDPKIIEALFKNLPVAQVAEIKKFILNQPIDLSLNYPKEDIKVPAIVMLLKNEVESNTFIGDIMGAPPNYDMPDQDMAMDTLGGAAGSVSDQQGLPRKILGPLRVNAQIPTSNLPTPPDFNSLTFVGEDQDMINEVFSGWSNTSPLMLYVISGAGAGQIRMISQISSDQLDIVGTFDVNCNNTSVVEIRESSAPEASYGSPTRLYDVQNALGLLRIGANYDATYQLEILAGNQEEVIYLYSVLKAVLFTQRKFFEAQGIMAVKITGTDLAPKTELLPDEVFTRTMMVQFTYPFEFLVEQDVAKAIELTLFNVNPATTHRIPGDEIILATIEL